MAYTALKLNCDDIFISDYQKLVDDFNNISIINKEPSPYFFKILKEFQEVCKISWYGDDIYVTICNSYDSYFTAKVVYGDQNNILPGKIKIIGHYQINVNSCEIYIKLN